MSISFTNVFISMFPFSSPAFLIQVFIAHYKLTVAGSSRRSDSYKERTKKSETVLFHELLYCLIGQLQ